MGDSRLYVVDKQLRQITRDHSLVQEMVRMGEITAEEARNHPDKNIITRALGAEKTVDVDFFDMRLEPGSICGPAVAVMAQREDGCWEPETVPLPDELTYFRWDEFQPEIDDVEDEAALLHQMLHFHEQVLNRLPSRYKELVTACLIRT